ncbi:hypothetical protein KGQ71_05100, partial [Patescibacteria group bacterium]|nr:hypothetical protein [Patescibacteria group bacterium]
MAETKNCKQCQQEFTVDDADLAFYNKISPTFAGKKYPIPSPTLCPRCRWQRRIVWRDEYILYRRKCDLSGRDMISRHHPDTSFPVYYTEEWQSDKWNPLDYGMDFDFNRPFFEQFGELVGKVPKPSVYSDVTTNQNSEYVNCAGFVKNCYMVVEADRNEDCLYSRGITDSKDCADCLRSNDSQFCYEGVDINKCYQCMYVQDLENCSECYFSSNLIGCKYCFGCDGLQQKQYYLFNEAVGKEKWEEFMGSVRYSPMQVEQYRRQLEEIRLKTPKRFAKIYKCENCQGDHLIHCKNTKFSFNSINQQDCRYCFEIQSDAKDAYDFSTFGLATSLVYECNSCGYNSYNLLFSNDTWSNMRDSFYCDNVQSSKSCFGCVGIRHQEFCILNKKYSKEQYEELVAKIIEHMQATGEWGEYFPMSISPFAYNETLAQDNFPLTKEE